LNTKGLKLIKNFADKETESIWNQKRVKRFPVEITKRALMRLQRISAAINIDDLRIPPSHRLEALGGDLNGFFSIQINDQWRVVFRFDGGNAFDVKIVDYH